MPQNRSTAIDALVRRGVGHSARVSWEGSLANALRGRLSGVRIELRGVALPELEIELLVLTASSARVTPGWPARLALFDPRAEVTVDQVQVDRWAQRTVLPFRVELGSGGILVKGEVAGAVLGDVEANLAVRGRWMRLQPTRARVLGVPNVLAPLFRSYLPLPPLSPGAAIDAIEHAEGRLTLSFALEDVEEDIRRGWTRRLQDRWLPASAQRP